MPERLVVIGGDAAGMSAASQARRRRDPQNLEIVAFERGRHTSYSACGIPYFVAGIVSDPDRLVTRTPEKFRDGFHIDARIRSEVTGIDLASRTVRVRDLEAGRDYTEPFDQLVVATGANPIRPDLPGSDASNIFTVQTLDDGASIRRRIDSGDVTCAVIIGGGYIGLEMAEALVARGLEVSLVEQLPQPMSTLDPDMGSMVADALRSAGVETFLGEEACGYLVSDGRVRAVETAERTIPADLVVLGIGVLPNSGLAEAAGVPIGSTGGLVTDARMRTSVDGVWAAGDCVETFHRVSRRPVAVALGTHANKQGRVAGINIGGGTATFPGVVGTAVSKICDVEVARTGLNESQAREAGFDIVAAAADSTTRAGYYPGAGPIRTKIVAERGSGRLLGAQIVGKEGAAKRIDVFATALTSEMTVEDIVGLDLSYAPPFATVWDPVLVAARKVLSRLKES